MPNFQVIYEHYQPKDDSAYITQKKLSFWAENMPDAKEVLETVKTMNPNITKIHWETLQNVKNVRLITVNGSRVNQEIRQFLGA